MGGAGFAGGNKEGGCWVCLFAELRQEGCLHRGRIVVSVDGIF